MCKRSTCIHKMRVLPHNVHVMCCSAFYSIQHMESMSHRGTLLTALTTIHSKLTAHLPPHAPAPLKGDSNESVFERFTWVERLGFTNSHYGIIISNQSTA